MEPKMDVSFESWGGFWLPANPENVVQGRLLYEPTNGVALHLIGSVPGATGAETYEVLFGKLMDGTSVTVSDVFVTESSFGPGVGRPTQLVANTALFGLLVPEPDQMQLTS
jgi:hypothetical protein